jgi:hypothetical protein
LVRAARLALRHDRTGHALAAGAISATAVETIATAAAAHDDVYAEHEAVLVDVASGLAADELTVAMRAWRSAADDAADRRDPFASFERRHVQLADTFHGVHLTGFLDVEGAAWVRKALARFDVPDPKGGPVAPRTAAQRAADALVELARASLGQSRRDDRPASGDPTGSIDARVGAPPVVDVDAVLDLHRLATVTSPREEEEGAADGALASFLHGSHSIGGRAVSAATIARLACDAAVTRIVLAGPSQVLDVGRTTRVVQPPQRRALRRRDSHCRFPGCDRSAEWTDAHHLVHWLDGGPTDLENLVLLCRRHHVLCHEGRWILARGPDGTITARRPDPSRPDPGRPDPSRPDPSRPDRPPPGYELAA